MLTILSKWVSLLPVFNLSCWLFCRLCRSQWDATRGVHLSDVREKVANHKTLRREPTNCKQALWKETGPKTRCKNRSKTGNWAQKKDAKTDRFQTKAVLLSINMPLCVSSQLHSMYSGTRTVFFFYIHLLGRLMISLVGLSRILKSLFFPDPWNFVHVQARMKNEEIR